MATHRKKAWISHWVLGQGNRKGFSIKWTLGWAEMEELWGWWNCMNKGRDMGG